MARSDEMFDPMNEFGGNGAATKKVKDITQGAKDAIDEGASNFESKLNRVLSMLEGRARDMASTVKEEGKKAEAMAQEHIWISLLSALGIGLVFGFLMTFARR